MKCGTDFELKTLAGSIACFGLLWLAFACFGLLRLALAALAACAFCSIATQVFNDAEITCGEWSAHQLREGASAR